MKLRSRIIFPRLEARPDRIPPCGKIRKFFPTLGGAQLLLMDHVDGIFPHVRAESSQYHRHMRCIVSFPNLKLFVECFCSGRQPSEVLEAAFNWSWSNVQQFREQTWLAQNINTGGYTLYKERCSWMWVHWQFRGRVRRVSAVSLTWTPECPHPPSTRGQGPPFLPLRQLHFTLPCSLSPTTSTCQYVVIDIWPTTFYCETKSSVSNTKHFRDCFCMFWNCFFCCHNVGNYRSSDLVNDQWSYKQDRYSKTDSTSLQENVNALAMCLKIILKDFFCKCMKYKI